MSDERRWVWSGDWLVDTLGFSGAGKYGISGLVVSPIGRCFTEDEISAFREAARLERARRMIVGFESFQRVLGNELIPAIRKLADAFGGITAAMKRGPGSHYLYHRKRRIRKKHAKRRLLALLGEGR